MEIFVNTLLGMCYKKGLYWRARAGELRCFTGIDSSFEPPKDSGLVLDGAQHSPQALADHVIAYLKANGVI